MKQERAFYRCGICGNLVGLIEDGGGELVCCGQPMGRLTPNSQDAAQEKHVPVAALAGDVLVVEVGSAPHPMTAEHHIAWIAIAQEGSTQRVQLDPTGTPRAEFRVAGGGGTVFAYCNLHGLWMSEF